MRKHRRLAAYGLAVACSGLPTAGETAGLPMVSHRSTQARTPAPVARPGDAPVELAMTAYGDRPAQTYAVHARNRGPGTVVAYGVQLLARDDRALLRPRQTYVVRPRSPLRPQAVQPVTLPLPIEPSLHAFETTFVLFDDGRWWGSSDQARREIAAYREEFAVLSALGQAVAATGDTASRATVRDLATQCARLLAAAGTSGARRQLEQVQRQLATGLDDRTRGDRSFDAILAVVRHRVERMLARYETLSFVRRPAFRS